MRGHAIPSSQTHEVPACDEAVDARLRGNFRHHARSRISETIFFHVHVPNANILSIEISMASNELEQVRKHWAELAGKSVIYSFLLSNIEIVVATHGSVTAKLKVGKEHLNSKGTLHGTVSACLTDWAGGLAIASTGLDKTGVSTDIHTIYISTAKENDELEIVGRATKVGKTLAYTTIEISKLSADGQRTPVCNGTHTKYVKA